MTSPATISFLGAGVVAQTLTAHFVAAGFPVVLSNSQGPHTLTALTDTFGPSVRAVTAADAAAGELVILAVPWPKVADTVAELPVWDGRILIDATNAILSYTTEHIELDDLGSSTSSEIVAALAPSARVVKAFNTLPHPLMAPPPETPAGRRVLFYSGDDQAAKDTVRGVLARLGYAPIDLGTLAEGGRMQQVGGPLAALDLRAPTTELCTPV